jgi:hypothetical protein
LSFCGGQVLDRQEALSRWSVFAHGHLRHPFPLREVSRVDPQLGAYYSLPEGWYVNTAPNFGGMCANLSSLAACGKRFLQ